MLEEGQYCNIDCADIHCFVILECFMRFTQVLCTRHQGGLLDIFIAVSVASSYRSSLVKSLRLFGKSFNLNLQVSGFFFFNI